MKKNIARRQHRQPAETDAKCTDNKKLQRRTVASWKPLPVNREKSA